MSTTISGDTGVSQVQDGVVSTNKLASGAVTPAKTQVGALPSMVRLNTANGYGSTNTMIRRFTNVVTNQGSDITYADSATLGASFTINTAGVYALSASMSLALAGAFGFSLNSSQLSTAIESITTADKLFCGSVSGANLSYCVSGVVYLPAGSVVRVHGDSASSGTTAALVTITRVA